MPTTGKQIVDAILGADYAGAESLLKATHPNNFLETIEEIAIRASKSNQATSGTSNSVGTGTKTFTLSESRSWLAGTPVRISDAAAPSTNYMLGTLDIDEDLGTKEIQVTTTRAVGSGTKTSWKIVIVDEVATLAVPPITVAQGGTGGTTEQTARDSLEVPRIFPIEAVSSATPGSPVDGQQWIVGPLATGAFATHENEIALRESAAWTFIVPTVSDLAFDKATDEVYVYAGTTPVGGLLFASSKWRRVGRSHPPAEALPNSGASGSIEPENEVLYYGTGYSTDYTLTLSPRAGSEGLRLLVVNEDATYDLIVNVTAGAVDGGASVTLAPGVRKIIGFTTLTKAYTF